MQVMETKSKKKLSRILYKWFFFCNFLFFHLGWICYDKKDWCVFLGHFGGKAFTWRPM